MNNKIFIDAFTNKSCKPPIWLMRQAGRYLSEYKALREKAGSFLNLCYDPQMAAEVALQPIRRFGFDAAIIFADILVVAHSMGVNLEFVHKEGPILERVTDHKGLLHLKLSKRNWQFDKIWETVSRTKENLKTEGYGEATLIGFAGAPWTVATYIMEGKGKTNFEYSYRLVKQNRAFVKDLVEMIKHQTINYIIGQIEAGAEVIQIFDTWAGILEEYEDYKEFVELPTLQIISEIKAGYPEILFIAFPKDIDERLYESYVKTVKPDAIGVSSNVSLELAKKLQKFVVVQGNLDPAILASENKTNIQNATHLILEALSGSGNFIFNLGHGILPETPVENVEFLVDIVRNYGK